MEKLGPQAVEVTVKERENSHLKAEKILPNLLTSFG